MHALLRELCERHRPAVLLVTHDVDEAIVLADRVLVLDDGRDRPRPRDRPADSRRSGDPAFAAAARTLLAALGVEDATTRRRSDTERPR